MKNKPTVLIFRDQLLTTSETFILNQGRLLDSYVPLFVGVRSVEGLALTDWRHRVVNSGGRLGRTQEILFKLTGRNPRFFRALQREKIALVHSHFVSHSVDAMRIAHVLDLPLVITSHGFDATVSPTYFQQKWQGRRYLAHRQQLIKRCSMFIAVSEFIKKKLVENGFPSEKITVHYIGINTSEYSPDPMVRREPIILFVGRLVEKKGVIYLIRAMEQVQKLLPDMELVVIGDGPERPSLEKNAHERLAKYRFLGWQTPTVVKHWLNRARIFAGPSIIAQSGDAEGFGLVFAEAQAMSLPVVSFASGGIPEAVAHGETGFLAPEKDWEQLGAYITELLTNNSLWTQFSTRARARVKEHFDLQQQNRYLEAIYTSVIQDQAKQG